MDGRMRRLVAEVETLRVEVELATRAHAAAAQEVAARNQAEAGGGAKGGDVHDMSSTGITTTSTCTIQRAAQLHPDTSHGMSEARC